MPDEEMREAIARGAKVLDRIVPGWAGRLKLERLNMGSCSLCVLGQLFGADTETAIAREMYPELWSKHFHAQGYTTGRKLIPILAGEPEIERIGYAPVGSDLHMLDKACEGGDQKCYWAEEVADRLQDLECNHATKRSDT